MNESVATNTYGLTSESGLELPALPDLKRRAVSDVTWPYRLLVHIPSLRAWSRLDSIPLYAGSRDSFVWKSSREER